MIAKNIVESIYKIHGHKFIEYWGGYDKGDNTYFLYKKCIEYKKENNIDCNDSDINDELDKVLNKYEYEKQEAHKKYLSEMIELRASWRKKDNRFWNRFTDFIMIKYPPIFFLSVFGIFITIMYYITKYLENN